MLSDKTLERVSMSFARGYKDGYAGRPKITPDNGIAAINDDTIGGTIRPFADHDYEAGYAGGANDKKWSDLHSGNFAARKLQTPEEPVMVVNQQTGLAEPLTDALADQIADE